MDKRYKTPEQRLSRYQIADSGCWEWQGALFPGGYGHMAPLYGEAQAHRASYRHHIGPIPEGMSLLHKCDNRKCINPDHLRPGTYGDNQRDAYSKGRRPIFSGSRNANAKLTEHQVIEIINDTRKQVEIAKEMGVSISLISAIKQGKAWRHLPRTANATNRAKMNLR